MQHNEITNRASDVSAVTIHSTYNFCISPYTQALTIMVCGDRDTTISIF